MALPALFHIQQNLGAVQVDSTIPRVQFRIFFPQGFPTHITSIGVIGDFQSKIGGKDWDVSSAPTMTLGPVQGGNIWTLALNKDLPDGYYEYKYQVTFDNGTTQEAADPCARYSGTGNDRSGFVIGGSTLADNVITPLKGRKPLRDLVVYELHAMDFTDEFRGARAPLDAIRDKLDYIADLGVNALLIMPWTAWKNKDFDWGYSPFQYFAVEYGFANDLNQPSEKLSWLKKLVSACHDRGIHVIMDGVYNHCDEAFPYKKLYLNAADCPYTAQSFGGTFPGLQDLDFNNQCTQDFIRDVCLYWVSEFKIDGIRFDNTVNYYIPGDIRGLPELLQTIQDYVTADGQQNFSMTLEHLEMDAASLVSNSAATSYWDQGLFGECQSHLYNGTISPSYLSVLNNIQYTSSSAHPEKTPTVYLSNHDHATVAWTAGVRTVEGAAKWFRTQPHVIALLTSPGTPLIPAGQEFAEDYWIPEDDKGSGRRVRPRPLRWAETTDAFGGALRPLYKKLLNLRAQHPALRSTNFHPPNWQNWMTRFDNNGFGVDTQRSLVVYHRWGPGTDGVGELFYVVLNFGDAPQTVTLEVAQDGVWQDVLAGGSVTVVGNKVSVRAESNWGHVFFKKAA